MVLWKSPSLYRLHCQWTLSSLCKATGRLETLETALACTGSQLQLIFAHQAICVPLHGLFQHKQCLVNLCCFPQKHVACGISCR